MQKRSLLYIGNKLSKKGATASSIDTLSLLLEEEGFKVYIASSVKNKVVRFLDMLCSTFLKARKVSFVLIDTYSTQNFYYAVAIAKLCRLLKAPYIPILHGGNLALRLSNNPKVSRKLFSGAKYCVSPSLFLLDVFKEAGINNVHYMGLIMCIIFLIRLKLKIILFCSAKTFSLNCYGCVRLQIFITLYWPLR